MYERFTKPALEVMDLANRKALDFNHEYIGTEHILLGLIKEGEGDNDGCKIIKHFEIDLRNMALKILRLIQWGGRQVKKRRSASIHARQKSD